MTGTVLLLAAGQGNRLGRGPKAFVELAGVPLVRRSADAAAAAGSVDGLVVVVASGWMDAARAALDGVRKPLVIVEGADTRQGSAARGLEAAGDAAAVAVHDAARALCPVELFDRALAALDEAQAVICALPVTDTVKEVTDGVVVGTFDRRRLVGAQTPQAFRASVYRVAHESAVADEVEATDDAALVERIGVPVHVVPGDERNLKITTALDLRLAEALLGEGSR